MPVHFPSRSRETEYEDAMMKCKWFQKYGYVQLKLKVYLHLAESAKCWLFYQVRGIIHNASYCLFSTDLIKIFHIKMFTSLQPVILLVLYHPPRLNKGFLDDFAELLSRILTDFEYVLITGDFNINMDVISDLSTVNFTVSY